MTCRPVAGLGLLLLSACVEARPFTDEDLADLMDSEASVIVYAVSDAAPLSMAGIPEIQEAAEALDLPLIVLLDRGTSASGVAAPLLEGSAPLNIRVQASEILRRRGIDLHYPSLLVVEGGRLLPDIVPGFKTAAAYEALVIDALGWPWEEEYRITRSIPLPGGLRGEFFKPIPGTSLVAVGWASPGYLLDTGTGETTALGEGVWGDASVTPDGRHLTVVFRGLRWFSLAQVRSGNYVPLFFEAGPHTYQSMGRLAESGRYRVLVAEPSSARPTGLLIRDYAETTGGAGTGIEPVREWTPVCDGTRISVPMLSKSGQLVSGMSEGTMRVFRIAEPAFSCAEVYDTGRVGGKAEFSSDDSMLVFVSLESDPPETPSGDVVVLSDLERRTSRIVYRHPRAGDLHFPAFMDDGVILFDRSVQGLSIIERRRRVGQGAEAR